MCNIVFSLVFSVSGVRQQLNFFFLDKFSIVLVSIYLVVVCCLVILVVIFQFSICFWVIRNIIIIVDFLLKFQDSFFKLIVFFYLFVDIQYFSIGFYCFLEYVCVIDIVVFIKLRNFKGKFFWGKNVDDCDFFVMFKGQGDSELQWKWYWIGSYSFCFWFYFLFIGWF